MQSRGSLEFGTERTFAARAMMSVHEVATLDIAGRFPKMTQRRHLPNALMPKCCRCRTTDASEARNGPGAAEVEAECCWRRVRAIRPTNADEMRRLPGLGRLFFDDERNRAERAR